MIKAKGVFIVLEGADGSGKGTQFKLLTERLRAVGHDVEVFDFPRYDEPSSVFVRNYLNGVYGPAGSVSPYTASLFYALDRYEAAPAIKKALSKGKIVLSNRFVGSNMAHQGGKFTDAVEQRSFFVWEDSLEFQLLGIPRPTINLFLRVPAEVSFELIGRKSQRGYTSKSHDEHEKDIEHLKRSVAAYDTLCQLFPKDFKAIDCVENDELLSIPQINDKIWKTIQPLLPDKPPHPGRSVVVKLNETQDGQKAKVQKNTSILPTNGAITLEADKVSLLTANQLKFASLDINCEITPLSWTSESGYSYYTHAGLSKKTLALYSLSMEKIANLHERLVEKLSSQSAVSLNTLEKTQLLESVMPLAALVRLKIQGSLSAVKDTLYFLQYSSLEEARWLGAQLQAAAHKQYPKDFEPPKQSAYKSQYDSASSANTVAQIAKVNLPSGQPAEKEPLTLVEARPRNEFDLLADSIYPYSNLGREDIAEETTKWSYRQKQEALETALKNPGSFPLKQVQYQWSLITDYVTFGRLQELSQIRLLQVQPPTPRYGYDVPNIVDELELDDIYIECFDESLKLFSQLQAAGGEDIATYCVLAGHKNRWQFMTDAKTLVSTSAESAPGTLAEALSSMRDKVAEIHPIIGSFILSSRKESAKSAHHAHQPQNRKKPKAKSRPRSSKK